MAKCLLEFSIIKFVVIKFIYKFKFDEFIDFSIIESYKYGKQC